MLKFWALRSEKQAMSSEAATQSSRTDMPNGSSSVGGRVARHTTSRISRDGDVPEVISKVTTTHMVAAECAKDRQAL